MIDVPPAVVGQVWAACRDHSRELEYNGADGSGLRAFAASLISATEAERHAADRRKALHAARSRRWRARQRERQSA